MGMKKIFNLAIASILFPCIAFSQNQGDAVPLGSGGTKIFCQANEAGTATSSDGKLNFLACDTAGRFIQAPSGIGSLAVTTPIPYIAILPTAVPTAFGTPQFAAVANLKSLTIDNSTNIDIVCAYGGSITPAAIIHGGSTYTENYASNGLKMSAAVGCARLGATPASGQVSIWGLK